MSADIKIQIPYTMLQGSLTQPNNPPGVPVWLFWLYLLVIATIEALTVLAHSRVGLVLYAVFLIALTVHSGLGRFGTSRRLALALSLVPLIRLLGLALPLMNLPITAWYPTVALPLLLATWVIVRQSGLSYRAIGLNGRNRLFHIMMMTGGIGLGAIQYIIYQPRPVMAFSMWGLVLLLMVPLIFVTSFTEEVIFRGLVQHMACSLMGRWGLVYGALIFAVLHIGYLSLPVVLFALLIGLLFAQMVAWSGSILGVALVHGTMSLTYLLLMPALAEVTTHSTNWMSTIGTVDQVALVVMLLCMTVGLGVVLMVLATLSASSS